MSRSATRAPLILAVVPLLMLPLFVGTCGQAPGNAQGAGPTPPSDILTAGN